MAAIWKPVPAYPGMLASSEGQIILPPSYAPVHHGGYRVYLPEPTFGQVRRSAKDATHVYRGITSRVWGNVKVHRAVCEAFHGAPPSSGHVVLHLNEDGLDNRPENLCWGTRKENQNSPGFVAWAAEVAPAKFAGNSGMRKPA